MAATQPTKAHIIIRSLGLSIADIVYALLVGVVGNLENASAKLLSVGKYISPRSSKPFIVFHVFALRLITAGYDR